jgi:hypothetical protein
MTKEEAGLHEIDMLVRLCQAWLGQQRCTRKWPLDNGSAVDSVFVITFSPMPPAFDTKCMLVSAIRRGTTTTTWPGESQDMRRRHRHALMLLLQDMLVKQIEGHTICALGDAGGLRCTAAVC